MASVTLSEIRRSFGNTEVLKGIELEIEDGEFMTLVGPSGCGKSTLLRVIAGLDRGYSGGVSISGDKVDALSPRGRNIAMVFQNYALYPHLSVAANIATPLRLSRLSLFERIPLVRHLMLSRHAKQTEIDAEVIRVAGQLKIKELLSRKPGQLSGGQRQRVALGRAMVRNPDVFLMDEPLSNLDAALRVEMRRELTELHDRIGATFVYVTHDQIEAMTMSSRVAVMWQGELLQVGTPTELYARPADLRVARFIGSPAINEVPARIGSGGYIFIGPNGRCVGAVAGLRESELTIAMRPENLRLCSSKQAKNGTIEIAAARVQRIEHLGAEYLLYLQPTEDKGIPLVMRTTGAEFQKMGQTGVLDEVAHVSVEPAVISLFDHRGLRLPAQLMPITPSPALSEITGILDQTV